MPLPSRTPSLSVLRQGSRAAMTNDSTGAGAGINHAMWQKLSSGPAGHKQLRYVLAKQHSQAKEEMKTSFSTIPKFDPA